MAAPVNTYVDGWESSMERCIIRRILAEKTEEEIFELRSRATEFDWNLDKLTICGTKHGHRKAGVYMGDADTLLNVFQDILDPLVAEFHSCDLDAGTQSPESYETVTLPEMPAGAEIISTRIRCARSVAPYPMTVNMTQEQRIEFEETMQSIFAEWQEIPELKGQYFGHTATDQATLDRLVEEHKLFCDDDMCLKDGGCYDDWPHGRGIYCNEDESFMVWVGEEDHIRCMSMMKGSDVQKVWDMWYLGLQKIDEGLKARGKEFMFNERYGYINCCPSNLGTGVRASVHVNLPAYATKADVAAAITASEYNGLIQARGTQGESKSTDGVTIYDISNYTRLGSAPEKIQDMINGVVMLGSA